MTSKFEIFLDKKKQFRFRFIAPNNEILFQSEAYKSKQSCLKGIESIQFNVYHAEIIDLTPKRKTRNTGIMKKKKTVPKKATVDISLKNEPGQILK